MADGSSELDALMAAEGVTPLRKPVQQKQKQRQKQKQKPPEAPARVERPSSRSPAAAAVPASPPSPDPALLDRISQLEADLTALRAAHAELQTTHAAVDKERRALARQLSAQVAPAPGPAAPEVSPHLETRGLRGAERAEALASMLLEDPDKTLAALDAPTELPALLDDALSICCADCQRAHELRGAVVTVDATRCEICGGSDTTAAFWAFAQACEQAGVRRVVLIGGSPNYRRELRALARGVGVKLELVDGRAKPRARRVKSQARTADMVVAWGGTIVDHATTNAFQAAGVDVVQVPHRGVGTMLRWLAARVATVPDSS